MGSMQHPRVTDHDVTRSHRNIYFVRPYRKRELVDILGTRELLRMWITDVLVQYVVSLMRTGNDA